MTPAINFLKKQKQPFTVLQYEHDPNAQSFGMEAVEKLNLDPASVFKTLVVELDTGALAVAVVPVAQKLNLKLMAKACGAKKAQMAEAQKVTRVTGYVLGGVSPLGQKRALKTVIARQAEALDQVHVSAGRRGLEVCLSPENLSQLCRGHFADIAR